MKQVTCPWCSKTALVNASGRLVSHSVGNDRCSGSGASEKEAKRRANAKR